MWFMVLWRLRGLVWIDPSHVRRHHQQVRHTAYTEPNEISTRNKFYILETISRACRIKGGKWRHTEHNLNHLFFVSRKIVDHVDYLTSPEQVADYVKKFR